MISCLLPELWELSLITQEVRMIQWTLGTLHRVGVVARDKIEQVGCSLLLR